MSFCAHSLAASLWYNEPQSHATILMRIQMIGQIIFLYIRTPDFTRFLRGIVMQKRHSHCNVVTKCISVLMCFTLGKCGAYRPWRLNVFTVGSSQVFGQKQDRGSDTTASRATNERSVSRFYSLNAYSAFWFKFFSRVECISDSKLIPCWNVHQIWLYVAMVMVNTLRLSHGIKTFRGFGRWCQIQESASNNWKTIRIIQVDNTQNIVLRLERGSLCSTRTQLPLFVFSPNICDTPSDHSKRGYSRRQRLRMPE